MHSIYSPKGGASPISIERGHWQCMLRYLVASIFSLSIFSLATAQESSLPLTLDAALSAAVARSATLQAKDAEIRAAREMAISASRLSDPVLRLSVDNLPIEGPMRYSLQADFMTMRSVSLMQTFTSLEKRRSLAGRYEHEADEATARRSMHKVRLLTQTAGAWFDRFYQEQQLSLLRQQREEASRLREAVESAYRGGRSSQADILTAHVAVAQIDDRLHEAAAALTSSRAKLQRWTGDDDQRPLGTLPRVDQTRIAEHELNQVINQHPNIAVMNARERVALAEADVAQKDKSTDWSWSLMYSKRGDQFGDMASIGISVPLQWDQARKQDRNLSAQLERVEQIRLEREEVRREQIFEVQRLLANWRRNLTRLADYDKTLIPLARERVRTVEAAFRGGKVPLAAIMEAQRVVIDIRLERLRIEKQTAIWWTELEYLSPPDQALQGRAPETQSNPSSQSTQEP